ncbi:MAG TPA: YdeI/OmpD-associated family protein [Gemmatimonadales bacterium]|nr:YdeI/OmpD-associated family protein [Gemmatimonadales bacterium]
MTDALVGKDGLPVLAFATQAAWEAWLEAHHASAAGLWLRIAKQGTGVASVSKAEALETALCFGWIDGQVARADAGFWLQRFTPRRPRSKWSQVNRAAAERLLAAGRMRPAGVREIEAAQRDGRWAAAYAPASTITVPDDLQQALAARPRARRFFEQLDARNRYAILYRITDAKRDETRRRRIEKFVAMLDAGETIY